MTKEFTYEELLAMAKAARDIAWIGYADGRSEEDCKFYLYEILKLTKDLGNY